MTEAKNTYLIVGLGNPGSKYAHTRHNVGFDVIDLLADRLGTRLTRLRGKALVAETQIGGERVALAQPQTFMNLSGESVVQLVNWYKPAPDHLIVCYDDADLPFGRLRVRSGGSAGTHNGMRSIVYLLGRDDFPRVRVGIGSAPPGWDMADWVLADYKTPEDRKIAYDAYIAAADAIETLVTRGLEAASQAANVYGKPPKEPKKREKPQPQEEPCPDTTT